MSREMKDSGVEWIGKIPKDWEVVPSNLFFYNSSEKVNAETDEEIVQLTASQKYGVISQRKYMKLETQKPVQKQSLADLKRVDKCDFVISLRSFEGGIEIAQESGGITPAYTVIKEKTNQTKSAYYKHLFKSSMYIQALRGTVLDTIRDGKSIKYSHFSMVPIVLPPDREQEKIAGKIDELNNNIANIIDNTKQSIGELKKYKQSIITKTVTKGLNPNLKMKESGIESFGEIPAHWKMDKIRNAFTLNKGLTITKSDLKEEGIPVISYGEIHSKYGFRFDLKKHTVKNVDETYLETNKNAIINQGDFIFADTSEDVDGSGNFTCYVSDGLCFAGYHTVVLKPRHKINYDYFAYLFESLAFRSQIQQRVQGIKVFSITQRILKPLQIILPSEQEQIEIVNYLDKQMESINKVIEDKSLVIEELESYKKSLIYEYVTGKKEA